MAVNTLPEVGMLRISMVATETLPGLLANDPPKSEFPTLTRNQLYLEAFTNALAGKGALATPWPISNGDRGVHYFWHYYLQRQAADSVQPDLAWRRLVPLRVASYRLKPIPAESVRALLETFSYPYGNAAIVSVTVDADVPLDKAVDRVIDLIKGSIFELAINNNVAQITLNGALTTGLDQLAKSRTGDGKGPRVSYGDPFSLIAVVRGDGIDASIPLVNGGVIHKALDGLCTFGRAWRQNVVPLIAEQSVPTKTGAAGSALYARRVARAFWFPELFAYKTDPADRPIHALGCFHRNLSFASMQTQSLLGLASWAGDTIQAGGSLPFNVNEMVRNCSGTLGMLYGGATDVYRSSSVKRQINDSGLVPVINGHRHRYDMPDLQ
jgi:hypothetical protein